MKFDLQTISVLLAFSVLPLILLLGMKIDRARRANLERPPQDSKLLRPAGYSLSEHLDNTIERVISKLLWASGLCGFAAFFMIVGLRFIAFHSSVFGTAIFASLAVTFLLGSVVATVRAMGTVRQVRDLRLGLRGEQAVAEVLHEVGDAGFRAFHDLPGGADWNIDHVVVGTRGVYMIETKARRRRKSRNGKPSHVVVYDGKALQFPSGTDIRAIHQAERNMRWLSVYLEKKTGEPVQVEPLVVLPGWFVEYGNGNFRVRVMNANYLARYLRDKPQILEAAQVRRIITALDEKCRDIEF